jgi:hypothetical protein
MASYFGLGKLGRKTVPKQLPKRTTGEEAAQPEVELRSVLEDFDVHLEQSTSCARKTTLRESGWDCGHSHGATFEK